jgi:hypothetical protein
MSEDNGDLSREIASGCGPRNDETAAVRNDRPRVMVGVLPERNGVPSPDILFDLIAIAQRGHPFVRIPYTRTDLARNSLAEHLLSEERFTHVLMLDADHRHPHDIVERLSRWVIEDPSRQVVAGLAFRRGAPFDPCMYMEADNGQVYVPDEWQGLLRVDLAGTAAMMISREVFERIPRPWFAFDYSGAAKREYPGEDMWFCRRCKEHGIPIWVDTTTVSPHLIENWVTEGTFRSYLEVAKAQPNWAGLVVSADDDPLTK